jgi:hypothetical protein
MYALILNLAAFCERNEDGSELSFNSKICKVLTEKFEFNGIFSNLNSNFDRYLPEFAQKFKF